MIVRDASDQDIFHVCRHMRATNEFELMATRFAGITRADIARELIAARDYAIRHVAYCSDDGVPIALAGAWIAGPRRAAVHLVATDHWLTVARSAYRHFHRSIPLVLEPNVLRAETRVLASGDGRAWFERLGFKVEGIARMAGQRGEDFLHVAWINPHPERFDV